MRFVSLGLLACLGCLGTDDDKGPEEPLPQDGKDDSHRRPTDHGQIVFGEPAFSRLTDDERFHAWTFELTGAAKVDVTTSYAVKGQRRTDTVLYLYKETDGGWGSYIARNDDYGDTTYSQLVRDLDAGRYRVLVKGYATTTRGKFKVTASCSGEGCAPASTCVFGQTYGDIPSRAALEIINSQRITAADLDNFSARDQGLIVKAVQQSSHTDVTTALEAIGRVDQGEINVTWIAEPAARRAFVAFEYGAGDNSYGAIFERVSGEMATAIHDGDLQGCTVKAETCLLPEDYLVLRTSTDWRQPTPRRTVTQASQLAGIEVQQALGAFARSYDDVTTVADGLSRVDGNELFVHSFEHVASGTKVTVFAYYAGDTSVGAIYVPGTTSFAGVIDDLSITGCRMFQE